MKQAFEFIDRYHMIERSDRVIVGISGGADSVCLLFVLKKYQEILPFSIEAVHVEHGLRGAESLEDAAFTERLCREQDIPFHLVCANVRGRAESSGISLEEAGRLARYEAFEDWCEKTGGTKIAVAHNANDQAETVLWNLVRGSGLRGMGGIRPVSGRIIRPLLETGRGEIEGWLRGLGIPYRTDRTNLEEVYTRNKLRLQVLPYLERELNFQAVRHIAEAGMRMQKAEEYLERIARETARRIAKTEGADVLLARSGFLAEEELMQEYLIRWAIRSTGCGLKDISSVHIRAIRSLAAGRTGSSIDLPGDLRAVNEGDYLRLGTGRPRSKGEILPVEVPVPGEAAWGNWKVTTTVFPFENQIIPQNKYTKWFDYDTIKNTIQMRSRRRGDYLSINDCGQSKKLKDYFIDMKIPREQREQIPLLADGSHIIWCAGYRISEAYKVKEHTRRILKVQIVEV